MMPKEQKIIEVDDDKKEKIVHCPACNGVILKLHGPSSDLKRMGHPTIDMMCPHCQKKLKMEFADAVVAELSGGEEEIK